MAHHKRRRRVRGRGRCGMEGHRRCEDGGRHSPVSSENDIAPVWAVRSIPCAMPIKAPAAGCGRACACQLECCRTCRAGAI